MTNKNVEEKIANNMSNMELVLYYTHIEDPIYQDMHGSKVYDLKSRDEISHQAEFYSTSPGKSAGPCDFHLHDPKSTFSHVPVDF